MPKKHELQAQLATIGDELEAMAGLTPAQGFKASDYEAKKTEFADVRAMLDRVLETQAMNASRATPAGGPERAPFPMAGMPKLYGPLKHIHDRVGMHGETIRAVDQAYRIGKWFLAAILDNGEAQAWCRENGVAVTRAQGEGIDSAGGFLVPEELLANVIVLREEFGVFRRECQVIPMARDTLHWPRRVGGLTCYFIGENQAAVESQAVWDSVNLTAKKPAVLTRFSREIAEDAVISIADWLVGEIAYAFALTEDGCGFNGDGSSTYGGIRGATFLFADGTHTAGQFQVSSAQPGSLTAADFTQTMGKLPQYAVGRARWYMSQQMFYAAAGTVLAKAGGNTTLTLTELGRERLLGFPVTISQALPITAPGSGKAMFLFGDLAKAAVLGDRRMVTIFRSDQRYFEFDQIGLIGTERMDINVHDIGDTQKAGPLVAGVSP